MRELNCVLLVDDNPGDNYLNAYTIKQADNCKDIKTACSSIEALSYLSKIQSSDLVSAKPEIIFLDINMPGMDGIGFLKEFEKLAKHITEGVSIFMLTSSTDPVEIHQALSYEFVKGFLNKPLQFDNWIEILGQFA